MPAKAGATRKKEREPSVSLALPAGSRPSGVGYSSISLCWVHLVQQRAAFFETTDVFEDDWGSGQRIGEAGDMRSDEDTRMVPEGMRRPQRLFAKHVERCSRKLPCIECRDQILLDEVIAA